MGEQSKFQIVATHVAIEVADLEETKRYLDASGIKKLRELKRSDGLQVVWYPGLELRQAKPEGTPGVAQHVAWEVDDIAAAISELKKNGVTFESDAPNQVDMKLLDRADKVEYAFFTTPVGLRGEIVQVTPEARAK
jgi:catechol 2,3-dioxygenase-like lactoylglutathione lyase family enzyme